MVDTGESLHHYMDVILERPKGNYDDAWNHQVKQLVCPKADKYSVRHLNYHLFPLWVLSPMAILSLLVLRLICYYCDFKKILG